MVILTLILIAIIAKMGYEFITYSPSKLFIDEISYPKSSRCREDVETTLIYDIMHEAACDAIDYRDSLVITSLLKRSIYIYVLYAGSLAYIDIASEHFHTKKMKEEGVKGYDRVSF